MGHSFCNVRLLPGNLVVVVYYEPLLRSSYTLLYYIIRVQFSLRLHYVNKRKTIQHKKLECI